LRRGMALLRLLRLLRALRLTLLGWLLTLLWRCETSLTPQFQGKAQVC
jgi:hypothetical protein